MYNVNLGREYLDVWVSCIKFLWFGLYNKKIVLLEEDVNLKIMGEMLYINYCKGFVSFEVLVTR